MGAERSCFMWCRCTFLYPANITAKEQSQTIVQIFLKQYYEHLVTREMLRDWQRHDETVYAVHGPEEKK